MNRISIVKSDRDPRLNILVDDRPLTEYFVGRRGAHPTQVFVVGWRSMHRDAEQKAIEQLLGLRASDLASGRIPLLVCEECGDVNCGALAARIARHGTMVIWSDWAYENGYETPKQLEWPTYPERLQFDLTEYEEAFASVAPNG